MNEIFSFHKELNIKKIIIFIIIIIIIIALIIYFKIINDQKKQQEIEDANPYSTFYSSDNSISVTLLKTYELIQYRPNDDYLMELRSDKNLDIFISYKQLLESRNLYNIVSADVKSYIEEFEAYSNLSTLSEITVNNNTGYTYSFHYFDPKIKTTFYLQTFWIQNENGYYIIDIEFPLEDLNNYTNIINDTLNSLTFY